MRDNAQPPPGDEASVWLKEQPENVKPLALKFKSRKQTFSKFTLLGMRELHRAAKSVKLRVNFDMQIFDTKDPLSICVHFASFFQSRGCYIRND